jgi:hypothetical protein
MKEFIIDGGAEDGKKFVLENKHIICPLIVEAVRKAFYNNIDRYEIFKIVYPKMNITIISEITKKDWINSLDKCLEYFLSVEGYEECKEVSELKTEIENGTDKTNKLKK